MHLTADRLIKALRQRPYNNTQFLHIDLLLKIKPSRPIVNHMQHQNHRYLSTRYSITFSVTIPDCGSHDEQSTDNTDMAQPNPLLHEINEPQQ